MSTRKRKPRVPRNLRDYFAGQALSGLIAGQLASSTAPSTAAAFATLSWELADAMLAARGSGS